MKIHLEPFAIAAKISQGANTRLDQILLLFGYLFHHFNSFHDSSDEDAKNAVCASIEKRWHASDQDVFVATLLLNPYHHTEPFGNNCLPDAELSVLVDCLYMRLFRTPAVPEALYNELSDYLRRQGPYAYMETVCVHEKARARAEVRKHPQSSLEISNLFQNIPLNPIIIWERITSRAKPSPLRDLAIRLLSVCPNSASCERIFSLFKRTMGHHRTRMASKNLMNIAELNMRLHSEYARGNPLNQRIRNRITRHSVNPAAEFDSEPPLDTSTDSAGLTPHPSLAGLTSAPNNSHEGLDASVAEVNMLVGDQSALEEPPAIDSNDASTTGLPLVQSFDEIARQLVSDADADTSGEADLIQLVHPSEGRVHPSHPPPALPTRASAIRASGSTARHQPASRKHKIGDLFDFGAEYWAHFDVESGVRSLDEELEFYELVEHDTGGDLDEITNEDPF